MTMWSFFKKEVETLPSQEPLLASHLLQFELFNNDAVMENIRGYFLENDEESTELLFNNSHLFIKKHGIDEFSRFIAILEDHLENTQTHYDRFDEKYQFFKNTVLYTYKTYYQKQFKQGTSETLESLAKNIPLILTHYPVNGYRPNAIDIIMEWLPPNLDNRKRLIERFKTLRPEAMDTYQPPSPTLKN